MSEQETAARIAEWLSPTGTGRAFGRYTMARVLLTEAQARIEELERWNQIDAEIERAHDALCAKLTQFKVPRGPLVERVTALLKRAEQAEAQIAELTQELQKAWHVGFDDGIRNAELTQALSAFCGKCGAKIPPRPGELTCLPACVPHVPSLAPAPQEPTPLSPGPEEGQ